MVLNIFFLTVTIKKRVMNPEEIMKRERIQKITEENKDRQFSMYRPF
ncbi:YrzI family small protein [Neobacillus notoginsengisoli]|uniref:YrzI family small protein n=1 Tax=Neobacillus notoginsengisoli TaxID=1578198 RepID=A0A417YUQ2_9BACI|nr:YrzI family small protein [Neobacillus notoginsengisoli]RHW40968.1 YrzI family small protein [Neobacillus notoginsengisoli]